MGYKLLVEKSHPVVEVDHWPTRIGKHYNESWIYDEKQVLKNIFTKDDVHLGHGLKPKAIMDGMLRMVLTKEDVERYWAIYESAPATVAKNRRLFSN